MNINKNNALSLWNSKYGKKTQIAKDYANRIMHKSAYGNKNSEYGWNIDHILPISKGGKNNNSNLICSHIKTNEEKANKYPVFKANGKTFEILKVNNHFVIKQIINPNVLNINNANHYWKQNFGKLTKAIDISGRTIHKGAYADINSRYGWVVSPINPNVKLNNNNFVCVHYLTNDEKGNNYPTFFAKGKTFTIINDKNKYFIKENENNRLVSNDIDNEYNEQNKVLSLYDKHFEEFNSENPYFHGEIIIKISNLKDKSYIEFIRQMFICESFSLSLNQDYYGDELTIIISCYDVNTKKRITKLMNDCIYMNTFLSNWLNNEEMTKYNIYFGIQQYSNKYDYFVNNMFQNANDNFYRYNDFGFYNYYKPSDNIMYVSEIVLINYLEIENDERRQIFEENHLSECRFKYIGKLNLYEFNYVSNYLGEELE